MLIGLLFHQSIDASGELARDYTMAIAGGVVFVVGVIMWALKGLVVITSSLKKTRIIL